LVGQHLAIGAQHDRVRRTGLQTTFQHMQKHRLATDFSDQLSGQAAGFQPGWDGEKDREVLIHLNA
jgi:hypothetical protein